MRLLQPDCFNCEQDSTINEHQPVNRVNTIPHHSSNHTIRPILFHSIVSHRIGESYCVIQMLVGLLNLGDAGTTHVGNPLKYQLFTVFGFWMNRRIEEQEGRVCKCS